VPDLDDDVTNDAQYEHCHEDIQLHVSTQEVAVCERDDEAERLPQAKVSERCRRLVHEQAAIHCYSNHAAYDLKYPQCTATYLDNNRLLLLNPPCICRG